MPIKVKTKINGKRVKFKNLKKKIEALSFAKAGKLDKAGILENLKITKMLAKYISSMTPHHAYPLTQRDVERALKSRSQPRSRQAPAWFPMADSRNEWEELVTSVQHDSEKVWIPSMPKSRSSSLVFGNQGDVIYVPNTPHTVDVRDRIQNGFFQLKDVYYGYNSIYWYHLNPQTARGKPLFTAGRDIILSALYNNAYKIADAFYKGWLLGKPKRLRP